MAPSKSFGEQLISECGRWFVVRIRNQSRRPAECWVLNLHVFIIWILDQPRVALCVEVRRLLTLIRHVLELGELRSLLGAARLTCGHSPARVPECKHASHFMRHLPGCVATPNSALRGTLTHSRGTCGCVCGCAPSPARYRAPAHDAAQSVAHAACARTSYVELLLRACALTKLCSSSLLVAVLRSSVHLIDRP